MKSLIILVVLAIACAAVPPNQLQSAGTAFWSENLKFPMIKHHHSFELINFLVLYPIRNCYLNMFILSYLQLVIMKH